MIARMPKSQTLPLKMVGSTVFGRYPKISIEQTFNMMISDDWLVPYAGYRKQATIAKSGSGRGLYASTKYQHLIAVVDNVVYTIDNNLAVSQIAEIDTPEGDVFIAENDANQIAITDKLNIYIFNYETSSFGAATIDFLPGYIEFQDGYFIAAALNDEGGNTNTWRLSALNNGLSWPTDGTSTGLLQSKPDVCTAVVRFPGQEGLIAVFGQTVASLFRDSPNNAIPFPYQREILNFDYGCLSAATIASGDDFIVWLGANEKSGPAILVSVGGGKPQQISNDGINFKLAELGNPGDSYGFLFKQDGHIFYQITFTTDNLSYAYDFTTGKFYTLCDENMNYHIARRVAFFNNRYFFVSFRDGGLYELDSQFTDYDGEEIPRVRVLSNIRLPDSSRYILANLNFTIEQGQTNDTQRVDLSLSKDGGESFSSTVSKTLNTLGNRQNKLDFWKLGAANDCVPQFRFWGMKRFVVGNGTASIYQ